MSRRQQRRSGKGALELIEEAVHLLRQAPARLLAAYYIGAVPFALTLLYYWADMSRGAFAWQHCADAAMGVSVAYLWMKCWQSVFAAGLYAHVGGGRPDRWDWRRVGRLLSQQALLQSTALFVLPVARVLTLPFGWVYSFYHNASLFGDGRATGLREVFAKSARQSALWPRQNHVLFHVLWFFGFFVFVNVACVVAFAPFLLKMFLGIETAITMSPASLLNTTFFLAVFMLTYLCLNPLIKAAYVLRCFYGESLHNAEDLKAELKLLLPAALALLVLFLPVTAIAADAGPQPGNPEFSQQLDRSIGEVLNNPEYTWRLPREQAPPSDGEKSWLGRFADSIVNTVQGWWQPVKRLLKRARDWFVEWLRKRALQKGDRPDASPHWQETLYLLLWGLTALVAAVLGVFIWRVWKRRQQRTVIEAEPVAAAIDVADENVVANQLPSDGWLAKAQELMEAGELRLALRALYLASLAELGQRELILIAKFKSNREYERELLRRAHGQPVLLGAFSENVSAFENAWYGMHEVSGEILDRFAANFNQIRGGS